jgi:hypothetical protein
MEQTYATMSNVVMDKVQLLAILKENKQSHDDVYNMSVSGYWVEAQQLLENKKLDFAKFIDTMKDDFSHGVEKVQKGLDEKDKSKMYLSVNVSYRISPNFDLVYPVNHTEDYTRAIKMLELSLHDKASLSVQEFNQYVLNDWAWKDEFMAHGTRYANTLSNSWSGVNSMAVSGCLLKFSNG